jgi:hypothetical protein
MRREPLRFARLLVPAVVRPARERLDAAWTGVEAFFSAVAQGFTR